VPSVVRLPQPAGDAVQLVRELADQDFYLQIVSGTGDTERDVETVAAVAEAAPERIGVRVAGNWRFDLDSAR